MFILIGLCTITEHWGNLVVVVVGFGTNVSQPPKKGTELQ